MVKVFSLHFCRSMFQVWGWWYFIFVNVSNSNEKTCLSKSISQHLPTCLACLLLSQNLYILSEEIYLHLHKNGSHIMTIIWNFKKNFEKFALQVSANVIQTVHFFRNISAADQYKIGVLITIYSSRTACVTLTKSSLKLLCKIHNVTEQVNQWNSVDHRFFFNSHGQQWNSLSYRNKLDRHYLFVGSSQCLFLIFLMFIVDIKKIQNITRYIIWRRESDQ